MVYLIPADENFPIIGPFTDKREAYRFHRRCLDWVSCDAREDVVRPEDWETVRQVEADEDS